MADKSWSMNAILNCYTDGESLLADSACEIVAEAVEK